MRRAERRRHEPVAATTRRPALRRAKDHPWEKRLRREGARVVPAEQMAAQRFLRNNTRIQVHKGQHAAARSSSLARSGKII
eukprot:198110-Pleurochrysis_carterae.AAC.1